MILHPEVVRLAGLNGDDIIGGIAALDTEHLLITVFTEVTHLFGGRLPGIPDHGGVAAAFIDDDVSPEHFIVDHALSDGVDVYPVDFSIDDYRAALVFLFEACEFIQVIGIRGKTADNGAEKWQITPEEWLTKIPQVATEAASHGITAIFPKVFLKAREKFECAGRVAENYFIFPNGRVYQCPLCEDYPIHTYEIRDDTLVKVEGLTEERFFKLDIAEGCVMNKLLQPDTIVYDDAGKPVHRVSCCLLKQRLG